MIDSVVDIKEVSEIDDIDNERNIPNYGEYCVDVNIEHNLYEDLTHKRPCAIKIESNYIEIKDWKGVLLHTLDYLAKRDPEIIKAFVDNPKMNGKNYIFFESKTTNYESTKKNRLYQYIC